MSHIIELDVSEAIAEQIRVGLAVTISAEQKPHQVFHTNACVALRPYVNGSPLPWVIQAYIADMRLVEDSAVPNTYLLTLRKRTAGGIYRDDDSQPVGAPLAAPAAARLKEGASPAPQSSIETPPAPQALWRILRVRQLIDAIKSLPRDSDDEIGDAVGWAREVIEHDAWLTEHGVIGLQWRADGPHSVKPCSYTGEDYDRVMNSPLEALVCRAAVPES